MAEQALKRDRIAGTRVNPLLRCKHHTKHAGPFVCCFGSRIWNTVGSESDVTAFADIRQSPQRGVPPAVLPRNVGNCD